MKSTQQILEILHQARPHLVREYGVKQLGLFGSYARGEQHEGSDVDIVVDVEPTIGLKFVDLADHIEALLGVRTEVVSRRAIAPRHWKFIEPDLVDVS